MNNPESGTPLENLENDNNLLRLAIKEIKASEEFSQYRKALTDVTDDTHVKIDEIIDDYLIDRSELLSLHPKIDDIIQKLPIVTENGIHDAVDFQKAIGVIVLKSEDLTIGQKNKLLSKFPYFAEKKGKELHEEIVESVETKIETEAPSDIPQESPVTSSSDTSIEIDEPVVLKDNSQSQNQIPSAKQKKGLKYNTAGQLIDESSNKSETIEGSDEDPDYKKKTENTTKGYNIAAGARLGDTVLTVGNENKTEKNNVTHEKTVTDKLNKKADTEVKKVVEDISSETTRTNNLKFSAGNDPSIDLNTVLPK